MMARSIQFRLTLWYSVVLLAGLVLFAAGIWFSMQRSLLREIDDALAAQARSLGSFLKREAAEEPTSQFREELGEYAHAIPQATFLQIRDDRGGMLFSNGGDAQLVWKHSGYDRVRIGNRNYRIYSEQIPLGSSRYQISIGASLENTEDILSRLRLLLMASIPVVILVASLGGAWLSRRALNPVDEITRAAQSIGIHNLSQRLTVPRSGDELQRLSEAWNTMLDRLEAAVKRLSQFTADASHELRTPLALIRTTAELALRRSRSPDAYQEALQEVVAESERMTQLVEDLLFLARCDSESTEMPMTQMDLAALVRDVCREFRPLAESRQIDMRWSIADQNAPIEGNEPAVRRVILILLDNALKYSGAGSEITVALTHTSDGHCLQVSDSGIGISADDLPRIFDRFYRADKARSHDLGGYGLGLSLAMSIARRHRANIQVTSNGHGSTFRALFPVAKV